MTRKQCLLMTMSRAIAASLAHWGWDASQVQGILRMTSIRALTCDTGGTILDWHSGIGAKLAEIGKRRGIEADWSSIANDYRRKSLMTMTGGDADFQPDFNIDDVHRRADRNRFESSTTSTNSRTTISTKFATRGMTSVLAGCPRRFGPAARRNTSSLR